MAPINCNQRTGIFQAHKISSLGSDSDKARAPVAQFT
jgi:hypothetical protein